MKSKTETDEDQSHCFMNHFLITIIPMHCSSAQLMSHPMQNKKLGNDHWFEKNFGTTGTDPVEYGYNCCP